MQLDPIKPTLKAPGLKRLKLNCGTLLSTSALKVNLRRYIVVNNEVVDALAQLVHRDKVGRCRL